MNQQLGTGNWQLKIGDRHQVRQWMKQCRETTLSLFTDVDHETFCCQAHPDFSPIGWHLGHIAYTEGLWLLEHLAGNPPQFPEYRRLFAADTLPKHDRVNLPSLAAVQTYLATIREQVFAYLDVAPLEKQQRLWLWLLQHESQHYETIAIVQALQDLETRRQKIKAESSWVMGHGSLEGQRTSDEGRMLNDKISFTDMVLIPAGEFEMGDESLFALDNERPVHKVYVEDFWIDRAPVTCGQYRQFMQAGGYKDSQWWSEAGWAWRQANSVHHPLYWIDEWNWGDDRPVFGVNWYEAEAYANFVGKRLPTEAEWEKAARWHCDRLHAPMLPGRGNLVWEWTDSWFDGYPGFEAYPYRGYSQAYFDGNHRVLRGGSWVTQPWASRVSFRNWYHPHVREIFAGFRCARSGY
ncbi:MAG: SUMF1/EgtB/PvdO family nonheme iron enzyme [Leptolyngbyaceae cyanobacterium bins.302]|nr:SUMF1/EgtB/PvdO family nonheme iron enzyme [Leptolyngbyaceae cyanobacterium bins.302]